MQREGCAPNARTFVAAAKACSSIAAKEEQMQETRDSYEQCEAATSSSSGITIDRKKNLVKLRALEIGMAVHSQVGRTSCGSIYVESCLVDVYAKCGSLEDAHRVFDAMEAKNMVAWTSLMLGYAERGDARVALELFQAMQRERCPQDARTFVAALKACSRLAAMEGSSDMDGRTFRAKSLEAGMAIHREAGNHCFESDLFVACGLVDMYAKCGSMEDARRIFERFSRHDVVLWTALILGYGDNGDNEQAVELFLRMAREGYQANGRTFVAVLKACSSLAEQERGVEIRNNSGKKKKEMVVKFRALETGMAIHCLAAGTGYNSSDIFVGNTLIDMYAKCGAVEESHRVFDAMLQQDVVSYNALMLGYAETGDGSSALELLQDMLQQGYVPGTLTFLAAVKACNNLAGVEESSELQGQPVKTSSLEKGMAVHARVAASKCDRDLLVASSLIDMYSRAGSMEDAHRVFDRMELHDVVSWTGLISGYADSGHGQACLELFSRMVSEGVEPDSWTLAAVLKACGGSEASDRGRLLHADICRRGLESDAIVVTGLIDLYAKCSSMAGARLVFDSVVTRDVVAWTALVSGYGRQGDLRLVFETFWAMVDAGVRPVAVTLLCVLSACSHAGLVEQGKKLFQAMPGTYGIDPGVEHYHCLIDLLARANRLEEALEVAETMPFRASAVTWTTILSACRKWRNAGFARIAFDALVAIKGDEVKSSVYLLLAQC